MINLAPHPTAIATMATLPVLDLHHELRTPYLLLAVHRARLFPGHRTLLILRHTVVVLVGALVLRRLHFEDKVITAVYTRFLNQKPAQTTANDDQLALVVCLAKACHIYYPDGRTYVVSLPFTLRHADAFDQGLILEKDHDPIITTDSAPTAAALSSTQSPQFSGAKFLTLVDPIGDFRVLATSLTSVIAPNDHLICFPQLTKLSLLCVTHNLSDGTLTLYHIRSLARPKLRLILAPMVKKRNTKHAPMLTPNLSRILDDDIDMMAAGAQAVAQLLLSMDKKRTLTLLLDVLLMARMVTTSEYADRKLTLVLRKDMILTKVDQIGTVAPGSGLKVWTLVGHDQEAVVVVDRAKAKATVHMYRSPVSAGSAATLYSIDCIDCVVFKDATSLYLVVAVDDHHLQLVNPFLDVKLAPVTTHLAIARLSGSCDDTVAFCTPRHHLHQLRFIMVPTDDVLKRCLKLFEYLAGRNISETALMLWRSATMMSATNDEWEAFAVTVLALVFPFDAVTPETTPTVGICSLLATARDLQEQRPMNYLLGDLVPYITMALHLIREDCRLDVLANAAVIKLGALLAQLTKWMGWPEPWTTYYHYGEVDREVRFLSSVLFDAPPNIFALLALWFEPLLAGGSSGFVTISQLTEESDAVNNEITPRTAWVVRLVELLVCDYGINAIIEMMAAAGVTVGELDTLPPGIALIVKEILLVCQEDPAFEWTNPALELIGRPDIMGLSLLNPQANPTYHRRSEPKLVGQILQGIMSDDVAQISPWDGQAEADRMGITKLIFDYDRRYYEITLLLHQTKPQTAHLEVEPAVSEYDVVILQRELARIVALRTLTIPMGRAALFFSGRTPLLTEKFPIAKFNLNCLVAPTMTNIVLADDAVPPAIMEWGNFHNGVLAGLSISTESKGINGSWIIFNKPPDLNAQHAGFLLGLGLNGHLRRLEEWHIYNYLGPKHPLTSVGLLLGMAASLRGTMDNKLTKVLSVHALALLPRGANDLNVPVVVQLAGLIGIGLLYLETQHRRMSEILLAQIMGHVLQNGQDTIHEGYRLSAGIALGLVNLAKGDDLRGLNDTHVIDRLMMVAIAMKDFQLADELDKLCAGAIIALAFIYLKTNNRVIAAKLEVPPVEQLLDYVRPDLLLLRCLARLLIMWDYIGNSVGWVEVQIPLTLEGRFELNLDHMAYFNIIGGTCMAMAVRYALTHDAVARDTLIHYWEAMAHLTATTPTNFDQRIAHQGALATQVLLGLCLAVVMAGSGDLATMRRLRAMYHCTTSHMHYGIYLGTNLALGFLFLGGGQYAIGSLPLAIAALVTSLYPVFLLLPDEASIYLEALRYFWALSIEPRCLVVRDVTSHKPLKVPVKITTVDGEVRRVVLPCLFPDFSRIHSLTTELADYFGVEVDFSLQLAYLDRFKQTKTLYVLKRRNYACLVPTMAQLLLVANKVLEVGDVTEAPQYQLEVLKSVDTLAKQVLAFDELDNDDGGQDQGRNQGLSIATIVDDQVEWTHRAAAPTIDDVWNLKVMFAFAQYYLSHGELHYVSHQFIHHLQQKLWALTKS